MTIVATNPLADFVSRARHDSNWSREDLSVRARKKGLTISGSYIAKIESGGVAPGDISQGKYEALAVALGLSVDTLVQIGKGAIPGHIADPGEPETRKPWPLHDLRHTGAPQGESVTGATNGKELSIKANSPIRNRDEAANVDIRTGSSEGQSVLKAIPLGAMKRLPVYRVSCGERILNNDEPVDWLTWPAFMSEGVDLTMRVEGDSMIGCGYKVGDLIFIQLINGVRPKNGAKVVAEVEGGAVCKLYQRDAKGEYLVSAPGDEVAFFCRVDESVRLVGIVKGRYVPEQEG